MRIGHNILVGKPRNKFEDSIKMDVKEVGVTV
jgi:hypothetical protein